MNTSPSIKEAQCYYFRLDYLDTLVKKVKLAVARHVRVELKQAEGNNTSFPNNALPLASKLPDSNSTKLKRLNIRQMIRLPETSSGATPAASLARAQQFATDTRQN